MVRGSRKKENKRPPSLYKKDTNNRPSSYGKGRRNGRSRQSSSGSAGTFSGIFSWLSRNPKTGRNVLLIAVLLLAVFLVVGHISNGSYDDENSSNITLIGNDTLGDVYKEGPFGNKESNVSIAYILGVHPKDDEANRLMEKAFKQKADSLNCKYYLYKINVTSSPTEYNQSKIKGEYLANKFAVPDIVDSNFTAVIDVHYSDGNGDVPRFVFSPNDNNTISSKLGHALANNFSWLDYYEDPDLSSYEYVTGHLKKGGAGSVIYGAYAGDEDNVTLSHDSEFVDFVDNWAFSSFPVHEEEGFSIF